MRRRILTLTIGLTATVILAFAVPLAFLVYRDVENSALDGARYQAEAVAGYISTGPGPGTGAPAGADIKRFLAQGDDHRRGTTWVVSPTGQVLGTPPADVPNVSAPGPDLDADGDGRIGDVVPTSIDDVSDGAVTQVQTLTSDGTWTVRTYLTDGELHAGLASRWSILAAVTLALLAGSVAAGELSARRLARPLEDAATTAHRLATGDTTARAGTEGPREVAEVGAALNQLADRIDEVIATEREAVADLSHRLRTPLTALRLDIDALSDPADAARLSEHATNLERSLTAVIHAARRPAREGRFPGCDAAAVVRQRVDFWTPLVVDQDRHTTIAIADTPRQVRLSPEDLAAAVDALIENVIAHTAEGTDFEVSVRHDTSEGRPMVVVTVADHGEGMPAGVGVRGRSDRGSTGLGIDIARRAADDSGGFLRLGQHDPAGARVEVWLGTTSQVGHSTT
ncbi:MAG: HAMP domain-containing sensor histidine kinase [Nocardioidaceae bacterium]